MNHNMHSRFRSFVEPSIHPPKSLQNHAIPLSLSRSPSLSPSLSVYIYILVNFKCRLSYGVPIYKGLDLIYRFVQIIINNK